MLVYRNITTLTHDTTEMGSADNLNLDCLELICAYLAGNDLVAASLVSRSFLAAVLPRLYRTIAFHLGNGKRYPNASRSRTPAVSRALTV